MGSGLNRIPTHSAAYIALAVVAAGLVVRYVGVLQLPVLCWLVICISIGLIYLRSRSDGTHLPKREYDSLRFAKLDSWGRFVEDKVRRSSEQKFRAILHLWPTLPKVSDQLNQLISYVLRDFISSWYQTIKPDAEFPIVLDDAIRISLGKLKTQFDLHVDIPDVAARRILPILTKHLALFSDADSQVRGHDRTLTDSDEMDKVVASKYRQGVLHPAAVIGHAGSKFTQQDWLRQRLNGLLPDILPEAESHSRAAVILVREILCCAILQPVFEILSDSDLWNQLIEQYASKWLQDRKTVDKVRAALRKEIEKPSSTSYRDKFSQALVKYYRQPVSNNLERLQRYIRRCSDLVELRQMEALLLSASNRDTNPATVTESLKSLREVITERSIELRGGTGSSNGFSQSASGDIKLADLMFDPIGLSYFMEYMNRYNRSVLVQFWLTVNGLKDPLEDSTSQEISSRNAFSSSEVEDIRGINDSYLQSTSIKVDPDDLAAVQQFLAAGNQSVELYRRARVAMLRTQENVYQMLLSQDFPNFKSTSLYRKYLATTRQELNTSWNASISPVRSMIDPQDSVSRLQSPGIADLGSESLYSDPRLVDQMSAALSDIILRDPIETDMKGLNDAKSSDIVSNPTQKPVISKTPIDSDRSSLDLPGQAEINQASAKYLERSPLFDDDDEDEDYGDNLHESTLSLLLRDNSNAETPEESSQVGREYDVQIDVEEELRLLASDVDQLHKEENMLDALIIKADIHGNSEESRILKKSKLSLMAELQRKETQRQLYLMQSKSQNLNERIRISSYSIGHERQTEYILYNITVQQSKPNGQILGSWIVGRRYNEFYQLHNEIAKEFPAAKSLSLPKKKVVMKLQRNFVESRKNGLEKYLLVKYYEKVI